MNKKVEYTILMIGPGATKNISGGIVTVIENLIEKSSKKFQIIRIITMRPTAFIDRLYIYLNAIFSLIYQILFTKNKKLGHIHMASKTSFYRKSLLIILLKIFNIPIIIHLHGGGYHKFFENSPKIIQNYIKWIFGLTKKTVLLSYSWKSWYIKTINMNESSVVYNGVKDYLLTEASLLTNRDNEILFLGRLNSSKGVYDLLSAFKEVVQKIPNAILKLAGDGEVDIIKKYAREIGISQNVQFLGWVHETEKRILLNHSKIYILPSYNEGLPMGVLEAMSAGLVVISTNVGGIPEVIQNQKNGLLITPGDIQALQENIINVLSDPNLVLKLGNNARKSYLENFNSSTMTKKFEVIYDELIK